MRVRGVERGARETNRISHTASRFDPHDFIHPVGQLEDGSARIVDHDRGAGGEDLKGGS